MKNNRGIVSFILCIIILVLACPAALAGNTISWDSRMSLPASDEQAAYKTNDVSPYIVFWPDFGSHERFVEYAVDFRAEHLPRGTYLSVFSWGMESSDLNRRYKSVSYDYGSGGYCGFQVLGDGSRVAILTVWDKFCTDKNGRTTVYRANQIYPENGRYSERDDHGLEGSFLHTLVPYYWKEDHDYRALVQIGSNRDTDNAHLAFWVCDLETGAWTLLVEYELGYDEVYMTACGSFLENFIPEYAGQVRSMVLSNWRAHPIDGDWIAVKSGCFTQNYEHGGSYSYGSTDGAFWAITTGIPGRCRLPADYTRYSVKKADGSQPY